MNLWGIIALEAWPIWTPGALLAGFKSESHYALLHSKTGLVGLTYLEKTSFPQDEYIDRVNGPWGEASLSDRGTIGRIYNVCRGPL